MIWVPERPLGPDAHFECRRLAVRHQSNDMAAGRPLMGFGDIGKEAHGTFVGKRRRNEPAIAEPGALEPDGRYRKITRGRAALMKVDAHRTVVLDAPALAPAVLARAARVALFILGEGEERPRDRDRAQQAVRFR